IMERSDLQRLLRDQIEIVSPDSLVIYEEFGDWDESRRRIDLLCIDRDANLVVVELKRSDDGGHSELQAIRYAAMVSTMTFQKVVEIFGRYLKQREIDGDPESIILDFLSWDEPDEEKFAQDVRIVLAAAEFSKELTSSVLWLNTRDLDIRCVRLKPYELEGRLLIDAQQVVPLPETAEFQIKIREKAKAERTSQKVNQWDEASFMADLKTRGGEQSVVIVKGILDWIKKWVPEPWWGRTKNFGNLIALMEKNKTKYHLFRIRSDGDIIYLFDLLKSRHEFQSEDVRRSVLEIAESMPGYRGGTNPLDHRPRFPIKSLADPELMNRFKLSIELMIHEIGEE
ncbi:MAG TPA: hypothetical protein VMM56_10575, partial [Planctomycetaceae bacterium]|nr:hypothetical protein [Planctomycetaceae bacterium]